MNADEARQVLETEKTANLEAGQAEINEVLERRHLRIAAQPFIAQDGHIGANVVLVGDNAA